MGKVEGGIEADIKTTFWGDQTGDQREEVHEQFMFEKQQNILFNGRRMTMMAVEDLLGPKGAAPMMVNGEKTMWE